MLESIFVLMMCMGFILLILGIELEASIYNWISLLMWIIVLASYLNIEVPSDTYYQEWGLFPISIGFILVNIIIIIYNYMRSEEMNRYRLR